MKDALYIKGKVYRVSLIRKSEKLFKITKETIKTKRWFWKDKETQIIVLTEEKTGETTKLPENTNILKFLDDSEIPCENFERISIISNDRHFFYREGDYIGRKPYVAFQVLGQNNGKDVSRTYIYIYETDEEAENAYQIITLENPQLQQLKTDE